ncbi:hypothetical protein K9L16_02490 [Candidatus Pacearchaeota archaeon]|nr:hypothetical protein [Candidatus Pacearchaeota archaeon]
MKQTQKAIIFDAGTLISFAMTGLFDVLRKLKKEFNGSFLITDEVKREIYDKPIQRKKFALEALRMKKLLDEGIIETADKLGVKDSEIITEAKRLEDIANKMFVARGKEVHLIDLGESSCLALSKILTEKGIQNVIAVDERTLRMLGEKPRNLKDLLKRKLHTDVKLNRENFKQFKGFKFIRSAELVYIAHKKKLTDFGDGLLLDALLYAVKFKGCAITNEEIEDIKKLK